MDGYVTVTVPLVSNGRITLPASAIETAEAMTGDQLEVCFKVVKKAPRVVVDEPQN